MKKSKKRSRLLRAVAAALSLGFVACAAFGIYYYTTFLKSNSISQRAAVNIYRATDYAGLLDSLSASGAVADMQSLRRAAARMDLEHSFKPGHYELQGDLNNKQIVRIFSHGWQTPVRLLVRPGLRDLEALSTALAKQLEVSREEILEALGDRQMMEAHGFDSATYIGMFIPDTYEVYWTITPLQLLDRFWKEYEAFWNESRTAKATAAGMSRSDVMTLASIVIEETKYEPEMPTIAGVYINRLKRGMPLQADPTVKYAVNDPSLRRILGVHLQVDSPYNTYRHAGLPPGPICVPAKCAIDATLNYQHHNYLYFCADESFNGRHNFASSLSEHMNNARRFHRALDARRKAGQNQERLSGTL